MPGAITSLVGSALLLAASLSIVSCGLAWNRGEYFIPPPISRSFKLKTSLWQSCSTQQQQQQQQQESDGGNNDSAGLGSLYLCRPVAPCDADASAAACAEFQTARVAAVLAALASALAALVWALPAAGCCSFAAFRVKESARKGALAASCVACIASTAAVSTFLAWEYKMPHDVNEALGGWFTANGATAGGTACAARRPWRRRCSWVPSSSTGVRALRCGACV